MHVGMAAIFQNPHDARSDLEVYRHEIGLASLAEPLGFDSVWGVEHHFTDYTMCPDVLQFLTFMAGRTQRIRLGSMVVVLPWHDPLRVAEQVAVLDNLSGGRVVLGIGRGLGRVEFEGFRVDMNQSRTLFTESAQLLLQGLEKGHCELDGALIRQPRRALRPAPFKSFRGRTYAAAVSPESSRLMAELGIGILIIPQKPWERVELELADYREIYTATNGSEPPRPICAGWVFCDEDEGRARELARRYIGAYYGTVIRHYELLGDHLGRTRGYESYAQLQELASAEGGEASLTDFFLELQVYGTPDQCVERILEIRRRIANDAFIGVFSYAGMPYDEAERSQRLFAQRVLPRLREVGSDPLAGV